MRTGATVAFGGLLLSTACSGGSAWMTEPVRDPSDEDGRRFEPPPEPTAPSQGDRFRTRSIGGPREAPRVRAQRVRGEKLQGRVLGTFRNTYYDFPTETEHTGEQVDLFNASCESIAKVPRGFFEAVCVQGSGLLAVGRTVSFAKRDCECAEVCPRTDQKICFDSLDPAVFPWGRGALGKAITPQLTVAVDDKVIPMNTPIYIPDYDGLPRDPAQSSFHDGCFIAQDRGSKVVGRHVDIFTGQSATTLLWNHLVPSNKGVTVVLDSPRCARAPR